MKYKINYDQIVITGLGAVTPLGCDHEKHWCALKENKFGIVEAHLFEDGNSTQKVGLIENDLTSKICQRLVRKIDRFTILSIIAAKEALETSRFPIKNENNHKIGIIIGNSLGGWGYVEHQMYQLCQGDPEVINPYVATAWFPTAPQGEISILYKLKGHSKTFSAGENSGAVAIDYAIYLIQNNYLDAALVGGVEAPLTPLVYNSFIQSGCISPSNRYLPFQVEADGFILGEGAGFIFIEKLSSAEKRNASIYAKIESIAQGFSLEKSMGFCLQDTELKNIDYVILDGSGFINDDQDEYRAIETVFKDHHDLYMSVPRSNFGNLYSGRGIVNIITACGCFNKSFIPSTHTDNSQCLHPKIGKHIFGHPISADIQNILINCKGNNEQCSTILISK
ncbi:MAG: beta-ketoacyl-[acyl-carrier-protein] synthase family protein [bacterium]